MPILPFLAAAAAAAVIALPIAAQRPGQQPGDDAFQKLLQQYDKNKDGKIQRTEYPRTDAAFTNLDRDGDGAITAKDFEVQTPRGRDNPGVRAMMVPAAKLPKVGDAAPDFELPMLGMKDTKVKLSSFTGKKPVALIFGSYT